MSAKKKEKKKEPDSESGKVIHQKIAEAVKGLIYLSETDAKVSPFSGREEDLQSGEIFLSAGGKKGSLQIAEMDFDKFFAPLTKFQNWFGEDERKMTEKFIALKVLLEQNLRQLKVYKIGKKEIEIFVVGLDESNIVRGIQTRAVET